MKLISSIQLNNISQTIYNLMTGVYDLEYFDSPYNECIPDDLTQEKGVAFKTYDALLDTITFLDKSLDSLNKERMDYEEIESLTDNIHYLQKTICVFSFKRGYQDSLGCACVRPYIPIYENYISDAIRTSNEIGNFYFSNIMKDIDLIKQMFIRLNDNASDTADKLDGIILILDNRFSLLCNKAYSYGQDLAYGKLPIWSNPEFIEDMESRINS